MNLLLIVLIILAVWRGWSGMKRGLVEEVGHLISMVLVLFILSVAILLSSSVKSGDVKNIVLSIVIILITGVLTRLIRFAVKSLSAIAHLPVLNMINDLLGGVIGIAEVVVGIWIVYIIIGTFDTGTFGALIMDWTKQSEFLNKLYEMNKIAEWMTTGL